MSISCPKCHTDLPEQEGFVYRFCPQCGAQITAETRDIHGNVQTIPPELDVENSVDMRVAADDNENYNRPANQTLAPEFTHYRKPSAEIKAPPGPAPLSFYRVIPADQLSNNAPYEQKRTEKKRSVPVLWILLVTLLIILAGGIYFIFLAQ